MNQSVSSRQQRQHAVRSGAIGAHAVLAIAGVERADDEAVALGAHARGRPWAAPARYGRPSRCARGHKAEAEHGIVADGEVEVQALPAAEEGLAGAERAENSPLSPKNTASMEAVIGWPPLGGVWANAGMANVQTRSRAVPSALRRASRCHVTRLLERLS